MGYQWFVDKSYSPEIIEHFSSLDKVFAIEGGERLSKDSLSSVIKKTIDGKVFYIKRYTGPGKRIRKFIGRSRCRTEWENLFLCDKLGIPNLKVAAYGEETKLGPFMAERAVLITEELPCSKDLVQIAKEDQALFNQWDWQKQVIDQSADYLARLHKIQFIHNDLNWRNILISLEYKEKPQVHFFDMPMGRKRFGWFFKRFALKDVAQIDRLAKKHLSRTMRLRFYLKYRGIKQLNAFEKARIKKIQNNFFQDDD